MRNFIYVLVFTILSCGNRQTEIKSSNSLTSTQPTRIHDSKEKSKKEICWSGTLNGKTPVFIHYQLDSNLIVGEITYLNIKDKLPIRLLGTIEDDKSYRLLEFGKSGNITGIIVGRPEENEFNGSWFSPRSKKELEMKLLPKDTLIISPSTKPDPNNIFGDYHYQYGESGYSGDFEFSKVGDGKAAFSILSLTNVERGPNIVAVEKDTIAFSGNDFIYKIPDTEDCEFKITFYKGFAYINYTKGYCESQFGLNATIDGIYLKTK